MRAAFWWLLLARLMRRGVFETPETEPTPIDVVPPGTLLYDGEPILFDGEPIVFGDGP